MDNAEEVAGGLVVPRGNTAILLNFVKELLDQMPCPVQVLTATARPFMAASGRSHDTFARVLQWIDETFPRIVSLVGDDDGSTRIRQYGLSAFQLMGLPRCQMKPGRVARYIDGSMDFRAQPAMATPDCLGLALSFFAPALHSLY